VAGRSLFDEVREAAGALIAGARHVRLHDRPVALEGRVGLDPDVHLTDAPDEERARYVLVLDSVNFGSGWFHELETEGGEDVTTAMSRRLTDHARARGGPWTAAELRAMNPGEVAAVLGLDASHELAGLYARALRDLGAWLGERSALDAITDAGGSADRLARALAAGMPFFDDPGFFKRAQITVCDLAHAGVAAFADQHEVTAFADNLVPHVLRLEGVLEVDERLAADLDAGRPLEHGSRAERELRAAAVVGCDRIAAAAGVPAHVVDNVLWNRGVGEPFASDPRRPHRTRTVAY